MPGCTTGPSRRPVVIQAFFPWRVQPQIPHIFAASIGDHVGTVVERSITTFAELCLLQSSDPSKDTAPSVFPSDYVVRLAAPDGTVAPYSPELAHNLPLSEYLTAPPFAIQIALNPQTPTQSLNLRSAYMINVSSTPTVSLPPLPDAHTRSPLPPAPDRQALRAHFVSMEEETRRIAALRAVRVAEREAASAARDQRERQRSEDAAKRVVAAKRAADAAALEAAARAAADAAADAEADAAVADQSECLQRSREMKARAMALAADTDVVARMRNEQARVVATRHLHAMRGWDISTEMDDAVVPRLAARVRR